MYSWSWSDLDFFSEELAPAVLRSTGAVKFFAGNRPDLTWSIENFVRTERKGSPRSCSPNIVPHQREQKLMQRRQSMGICSCEMRFVKEHHYFVPHVVGVHEDVLNEDVWIAAVVQISSNVSN